MEQALRPPAVLNVNSQVVRYREAQDIPGGRPGQAARQGHPEGMERAVTVKQRYFSTVVPSALLYGPTAAICCLEGGSMETLLGQVT